MHVTEVRIKNYKSIKDTGWVPIEDDITTLLGRNESGKTSFLEAIRYFDEDRELKERELHDGKNYTDKKEVEITNLKLRLDDFSAEKISEDDHKLEGGDEIIATKYADNTRKFTTTRGRELKELINPVRQLQNTVDEAWQDLNNLRNKHSGQFRNHFDNQIKSDANRIRNNDNPNQNQIQSWTGNLINGLEGIPEQNDDIIEAKERWLDEIKEIQTILNHANDGADYQALLPPVIYHSGFDTISDEAQVNNLESDDYRTFSNLLDIVNLDYEEFDQLDNHGQNKALETAEGTISGQVNEFWKQKEVDVDIRYRDNRFMVGIKDTALNSRIPTDQEGTGKVRRSLKRPSDRSKGFQWFFSFFVNLRAETDSEESSNQIILLDDPAVFLHPEGKKNWLSSIEELSESAQIIYSSHSPFLIRKEYPNRIRVVEDREEDGTVVTDDFHESDAMTLEPLRNALGIGLGDSPFVSKRKILVEGVSDYHIITGLANYFRQHLQEDILSWEEVTIMPTNGADNMIHAAKWVASEEFSYVLLLDNDQKGKNVIQEIRDQHQEIDPDRVILLEKDDDQRNFNIDIEDMFNPEFYIDCVNTVYEENFESFDPIQFEQNEDGWMIDGYEYNGRKIINRIEDSFEDKDIGKLNKILVANEIQERLNNNDDVAEDDVKEFKKVLGQVRNLT